MCHFGATACICCYAAKAAPCSKIRPTSGAACYCWTRNIHAAGAGFPGRPAAIKTLRPGWYLVLGWAAELLLLRRRRLCYGRRCRLRGRRYCRPLAWRVCRSLRRVRGCGLQYSHTRLTRQCKTQTVVAGAGVLPPGGWHWSLVSAGPTSPDTHDATTRDRPQRQGTQRCEANACFLQVLCRMSPFFMWSSPIEFLLLHSGVLRCLPRGLDIVRPYVAGVCGTGRRLDLGRAATLLLLRRRRLRRGRRYGHVRCTDPTLLRHQGRRGVCRGACMCAAMRQLAMYGTSTDALHPETNTTTLPRCACIHIASA